MKSSLVNIYLAQLVILFVVVKFSHQQTDTACQYQNCAVCPSENWCTECRTGTWGYTCQSQCPAGCVNNTCSIEDGFCELGCQQGSYGTTDCPCSRCWNLECDGETGTCKDGCRSGYYGPSCSGRCDTNCYTCTDTNNNCRTCKSGYYGPDCTSICSSTCSRCTDRDTCTLCKTGYYGPTCQFDCSAHCKNDRCEKDGGSCTDGCDFGYHGPQCTESCGPTCSSCRDRDTCTVCMTGYFGETCQHTCSERCRHGHCDRGGGGCSYGCADEYDDCPCPDHCKDDLCDRDGYCTNGCDDGYYWDRCSSLCNSGCLSCVGHYDNCTACKPGRYGDKCSKWCYYRCSKCITGAHDCTECKLRFFGPYCNFDCNTTCQDGTCDKSSGHCTKECTGQNFGVSGCPCPENCKDAACGTGSGRCTAGCLDGFYGDKCNRSCNGNCLTCSTVADKCTACKTGFYGSDCGSICSPNCKNKACHKINGTCTDGCESGFHGDQCRCSDGSYSSNGMCRSCTEACTKCTDKFTCTECTPGHYLSSGSCLSCSFITGCLSCTGPASCTRCQPGLAGPVCCPQHCTDGQCSDVTGSCTQGCVNGTYGERCNRTCSSNCITCQQTSGQCLQCADGYYGPQCDEPCSDDCALTNGKRVCAINDGNCTSGCAVRTKHGPQCSDDCSDHCADQECDQATAHCDKGCEEGYHGFTCNEECSRNCADDQCFHTNGSCVLGCVDGFTGNDCQQALSAPDGDDGDGGSSSVPAAVGAGVAAAVLLVIAAVVVLVILRRRNKRKTKEMKGADDGEAFDGNVNDLENMEAPPQSVAAGYGGLAGDVPLVERPVSLKTKDIVLHPSPVIEEDGQESLPLGDVSPQPDPGHAYYNTSLISRSVTLNNLQAHVAAKPKAKFKHEFESLPRGCVKPVREARKKENIDKNRYKEIYPYDETRVILRDGEDYINASYIDGFNSPKAYIAALGTIPKTIPDFWRMVWQEGTGKIVMLTRLQEASLTKCYKYWPERGNTEATGEITVTTDAEEVFAEFVVRSFTVALRGETRRISHLQYTAWPDKGVPDDVTSLVEFRQKVQSTLTSYSGPTIVHCSAGIGRTGTYIALDYLTREGEQEGSVNILGCVARLREQRPNMVQTEEQYVYLHYAVAHSLTFDCQNLSSDQFQLHYSRMTKPLQHGDTLLETQFKQLQETLEAKEKDDKSIAKNMTYNRKNRPNSTVASDRCRPRLHLSMSPGQGDYINAVYVNTYKMKDGFIVTQTPLPDTVEDFWKLVFQEHSPCIVRMEQEDTGEEDIGVYWPTTQDRACFGQFTIHQTHVEENDSFAKKTFNVSLKEKTGARSRAVTQFTYKGWPREAGVPKSFQSLHRLVTEVEKQVASSDTEGPTIVHCLDGATRSGLYCTVSVLLEKMKVEHEVSVVNTVRQVKTRRPQLIPTYEQYRFCHAAVSAYLDTFNTYSNFTLR